MRRALRVLACAGLVFACALPAGAQPAPGPHELALAKRYIAAVHMEKMMESMMTSMMPGMINAIAKQQGGAVSPEVREAITEAAAESAKANTPRMEALMAPVIARSFTEAELQAAVTYYESEPGQSLMAKMPAYLANAAPSMTALMPEMAADMQARLCRKIACAPASKP